MNNNNKSLLKTISTGVLLMLISISIILSAVGCQNQTANVANGESMIRSFAQSAFPGYEIVYISCARMDTDNDGYLRATLTVRNSKDQTLRVFRLDVSESGDPFQLQKAATVSLSAQQPYDNRL